MPRPRTIDDAVLLDAAGDLLARVGPANVTLARVGEEVGLSAATLVQRFGSKRGLLLAIANRAVDWSPTFDEARERNPSPLGALVDALCALTADVRTPEAMANSVAFLQLDLTDPEFGAITRAAMRELRALIHAQLDDAVAAGELAGGTDTERLAAALEVTYNGALITWAIHRTGPVEAAMRSALEYALRPASVSGR
jgi:AcrR family transcriptional regulator